MLGLIVFQCGWWFSLIVSNGDSGLVRLLLSGARGLV